MFICIEEYSDRGAKNAGTACALPRRSLDQILHGVGACGRQGKGSLIEVRREPQPLVQMLADYFIRVAQFDQAACNLIHSVLM